MNIITQNRRFRQALIEYSFKYGVTKSAIRYKIMNNLYAVHTFYSFDNFPNN